MTVRGAAKWAGISLGMLVLAVALFLAFFDWNLARGFINERVSAQLGRPFAIRGDLDVDFFPTRVTAHDVVIANAPWGSRGRMAEVDTLAFTLRLLPLILGRVVLPEIALRDPDVLLERGKGGRANWQFAGLEDKDAGAAPVIGHLLIEDGRLRYRDPQTDTDIRARVETRTPEERGAERPLVVEADGRYRGEPFSLKGRGGSLLAFRQPDQPYPLDVQAQANKTNISVEGTMTDPAQLAGLDIDLRLSGPDLQRLEPIVRVKLPPTPSYRLQGQLEHAQRWWRLRDFAGTVGESHLAGEFSIDFSGERPYVEADLVSKKLDLEDLTGFLGAPPGKGVVETAEKRGRVLPDQPFDIPELRRMDANVEFRARQVKRRGVPIDEMVTHLMLDDAVLTLNPLRFRVASGALEGKVRLDARETPAVWAIDMKARNLDLGTLLPSVRGVEATSARMGARVDLKARGNSIGQMLGTADGDAGFVVTQAEISKLLVSAASLDIARTVASFFGGKEKIPLRCAVADFRVQNGRLRPEIFVIDTALANFYLDGVVLLGKERLDLTVTPEAEGPTLSANAPLTITGSFVNPEVDVGKEALARGAAAVALGVLAAPLAALVPLVDPGEEKEHACAALIERVREEGGAEKKGGGK